MTDVITFGTPLRLVAERCISPAPDDDPERGDSAEGGECSELTAWRTTPGTNRSQRRNAPRPHHCALGHLTLGDDVDHVRQGRGLAVVLYLVAVGAVVSIATTLVVLVRYRAWSRPVAMAMGVTTVVGVGAVHVAPEWSHLADSYAAADAALSWLLFLAMMLAGLALTIVAAQADR